MDPFKVCFISSEVAPLAKTGGLADVASALPAHLARQGHDVRVFCRSTRRSTPSATR
ncbi:MAG: glycogen synthase [Thermoanaerobaculia bacterium]|nr:glycogen synthase [Thermoanaerobaculia bacterium]